MQREPSDSSTGSASKRIRRIGSRLARFGSKKDEREPTSPRSSTQPLVQKFVQELDATESGNGASSVSSLSPAPLLHEILKASDDPSFQQLRDNTRRLQGASLGVNGVDSTFSAYARCREQSLELCKALVQKAKGPISSSSFDVRRVGSPDFRQFNGSMNDVWLTALEDFKTYQENLLENLRESLVSTYQRYIPEATATDKASLLSDKTFRSVAIAQMETTRFAVLWPGTSDYLAKYIARFKSYDLLKLDLAQIETLCAMARSGKGPDVTISEYEIATNGDTILEFANSTSQVYPVLRFRVLSYVLIEVSPLFAKILSSSYSEINSPLEMPEDLPPPPQKQVWKDGAEVKVYRMPHLELNTCGSLTTLLHAAHIHTDKIPRQISFHEFISIAEVCFRYQCTSPLEMAVEYQWLPQWLHKAHEDYNGLVLISYVFGIRGLFTRMSKSAILNITCREEEYPQELWPPEVKSKIYSMREAKISQIYTACNSAIREFLRPPLGEVDKDGGVTLTSVPRCPRRLHQCDATNLGWLMLIYNETGILHTVMNPSNDYQSITPVRRSINQLVNSLRRLPSAPQMHSGVCDHAPAFRKAMDDIYNSINGLTLRDVSGRGGWALSKRHESSNESSGSGPQQIFELEAPVAQISRDSPSHVDEAIAIRIFSHIDNLRDLHAVAMVNRSFYSVYKKHELVLMKNIIKAGRQNIKPRQRRQNSEISTTIVANLQSPIHANTTTASAPTVGRLLPIQDSDSDDDLTPPASPLSPLLGPQLPPPAGNGLPWPRKGGLNADRRGDSKIRHGRRSLNHDLNINQKFLSGDIVHDKSLVVVGKKHLQEEQDRSLRSGFPNHDVHSS